MAHILYTLTGAGLLGIGFNALFVQAHLLKKILAINVMAAGVSLMLVAEAGRRSAEMPDPVPLALVITGIVVLVSATAFALSLLCRLHEESGQGQPTEEERR